MSLPPPSGMRDCPGVGRVQGYDRIDRVLQQCTANRDYTQDAQTSIARGNRNIRRIGSPYDCAPHDHKREISRRQRQAKRAA